MIQLRYQHYYCTLYPFHWCSYDPICRNRSIFLLPKVFLLVLIEGDCQTNIFTAGICISVVYSLKRRPVWRHIHQIVVKPCDTKTVMIVGLLTWYTIETASFFPSPLRLMSALAASSAKKNELKDASFYNWCTERLPFSIRIHLESDNLEM